MPTKQYTVGSSLKSPLNGQTEFESDFLKSCQVDFIVVNNIIETQLNPNPDFVHNYIEGKLIRKNPFQTGDKVVIVYSKCNCK